MLALQYFTLKFQTDCYLSAGMDQCLSQIFITEILRLSLCVIDKPICHWRWLQGGTLMAYLVDCNRYCNVIDIPINGGVRNLFLGGPYINFCVCVWNVK